jgi:hypothetical protein
MISFIAGVLVGILCTFGALGLLAALAVAMWRDSVGEALWR